MLRDAGFGTRVAVGDFFEHETPTAYDAVVGNTPFVRYQNFSGVARARGLEAALAQGVRLTGLANAWAAFVVKAALHLAPEGRLALVLPAELLSVNYAQEVRRLLLRRFGRIRLIMFEERIFPGVLEEVVLLLAEGSGGADCLEIYLPVPSLERIKTVDKKLRYIKPQLAQSLRSGNLNEAVTAVDSVVLAGIPNSDLRILRLAREVLFERRRTRGKSGAN